MKKFACQYSVVQFMPYAETREFANVGVVLICPETGFFGFRLMKHYGRVTQFFEAIDRRIFLEGKLLFHAELLRIREEIQEGGGGVFQRRFVELTRRRESLFRFDEPAVVFTVDAQSCLDEQYRYFVERDFATREYHEQLLERDVRKWLRDAHLGASYKEHEIGDEMVHARFPFVVLDGGQPLKLIKPLFLAQAEPSRIIAHADVWIPKLRRLRSRRLLPRDVLFALDAPPETEILRYEAFEEVRKDLRELDVQVEAANNPLPILQFARA